MTLAIRPGIALGVLMICGNLLPQAAAAAPACAPTATAKAEIVGVMEGVFAAFRADDWQRFQQISATDFYAYDGGARFTGPALMDLIKHAHAGGKRWEWSITDPEVHVACNLAWITYVNRGSVQDTSRRQALTWLESAILEYANARWRIRFLHSTRAQETP